MKFIRKTICYFGGHNLSPAVGTLAAQCTFCDGMFAQFQDDQDAHTLPFKQDAFQQAGGVSNGYEDDARVGAAN